MRDNDRYAAEQKQICESKKESKTEKLDMIKINHFCIPRIMTSSNRKSLSRNPMTSLNRKRPISRDTIDYKCMDC